MATLAKVMPPGLHLLLVDNSGNTRIGRIDLSHFDAEIIHTDSPLGFAAANNLALLRANHVEPTVAFLNQDTLSRENWLAPCLASLQARADVAAVTPLTRRYDGSGWDPHFLECARRSRDFARAVDSGQSFELFYEVPAIPAAAMLVRREALATVGPFDPVYGSYYEDYDFCDRLRRAGWQVGICTEGVIAHQSGSATDSEAAERRRARWVTRNRVILGQRQQGARRLGPLLRHAASTFPRGLARSLLGRPGAKPAGAYLAAHWDLLKLSPRLLSERRDNAAWRAYLDAVGWPPAALAADTERHDRVVAA